MRMVAGTSRTRMIVASTKTATARPRPTALVMMTLLKANAPVTTMIMAAADVMIPAADPSALARLAGVGAAFLLGPLFWGEQHDSQFHQDHKYICDIKVGGALADAAQR